MRRIVDPGKFERRVVATWRRSPANEIERRPSVWWGSLDDPPESPYIGPEPLLDLDALAVAPPEVL